MAADGIAASALVATMLAGSAGLVSWVTAEIILRGQPSATGASIAAIVGLVAITPAAGFVTPMAAIVIGALGALTSYGAVQLLGRTRLDDTLDVFACHGVGGIVGSILTGVFATTAVNPAGADGLLITGTFELVGVQVASVVVAATYAAAGTWLVLTFVGTLVGLRTPSEAEAVGIDVLEHAELAYNPDSNAFWVPQQTRG